ncbi:MAG: NAD(P)H-hydrate dehydratase, partial [Acidimicrobiales bacterium]
AGRFGALVVGPGLGRSAETVEQVRQLVAGWDGPCVIDGDGLVALGRDQAVVLGGRPAAVLTPHDGEFEALTGSTPGPDRIEAARSLANELGAVVLLKGPTTVVADPRGNVRIVTTGDARLATAGTGDVLSGVVGALLAQGMSPLDAAAAGAWLHGRAAAHGPHHGLTAGDLPDLLVSALDEVLP